jgi:hypothetical protein
VAVLDASHLFGVGVIIGERFVYVRDVQVVPVDDAFRVVTAVFDANGHVSDGDPVPLDVGLVVDVRLVAGNDPVFLSCYRYAISRPAGLTVVSGVEVLFRVAVRCSIAVGVEDSQKALGGSLAAQRESKLRWLSRGVGPALVGG